MIHYYQVPKWNSINNFIIYHHNDNALNAVWNRLCLFDLFIQNLMELWNKSGDFYSLIVNFIDIVIRYKSFLRQDFHHYNFSFPKYLYTFCSKLSCFISSWVKWILSNNITNENKSNVIVCIWNVLNGHI